MRHNLTVVITAISLVLTILTSLANIALAQQPGATTDAQKYNSGYTDGLRVSKEDFKGAHGHGCDPTLSPGHSIPYQKGYAVGYSKGPCGEGASPLQVNGTNSSPLPGILFPGQ